MIFAQQADITSWFDRGIAIAVITFGMIGLAWMARRYFGKEGIADKRSQSVSELASSITALTQTCHDCRSEQKDIYGDLQREITKCVGLLEGK